MRPCEDGVLVEGSKEGRNDVEVVVVCGVCGVCGGCGGWWVGVVVGVVGQNDVEAVVRGCHFGGAAMFSTATRPWMTQRASISKTGIGDCKHQSACGGLPQI